MNLFLIRHTRVDVPYGMCYGRTDVPLAPTFAAELKEIQQKLAGIPFDAVYSSPSTRCGLLAVALAGEQPVKPDSRLLELDFGAWEGKLWDGIEGLPGAKEWFQDYLHRSCPGGESYQDLLHRVRSFYEMLNGFSNLHNVMIVTHSGVVRSFVSLVRGTDSVQLFSQRFDFGSITQLKTDE